jgi:RecB family exonuclease
MDFFALAPLRYEIPSASGAVRPWAAAWDKISRQAGVTRGVQRWKDALEILSAEAEAKLEQSENEGDRRSASFRLERSRELAGVISELATRLEVLEEPKPAAEFIEAFRSVILDYFRSTPEGFEEVLHEVEQLGTVDAVGGTFTLQRFHEALRANLEAGSVRASKLGEGVLVADYRLASGLRFKEVVLCGVYEGAFPAGPGGETVLDDRVWSRLREEFPFIEDSELTLARGRDAARRAIASAGGGTLTWSCPLYEPGGTREFYPAPLMVSAANARDPGIRTATGLRRTGAREWLRRAASPLGVMLGGSALDGAEFNLRQAILARRAGGGVADDHRSHRAVTMLRARRSNEFTQWDGNLGVLSASGELALRRAVYPTSLEHYAACGFRYMCRTILGLRAIEEPEERETMDAAARGTLVHGVLDVYFRRMKERGRPRPGEAWNDGDRAEILAILDDALEDARRRGLTGRAVYSGHEARTLRSDLLRFLDEDTAFREETGGVPSEFEVDIPETMVAGATMRGRADRVDRSPDGSRAWVIDYKTGGLWDYDSMKKGDTLDRGTKLQLPVYLAAAGDAREAQALYWFITRKGGFERIAFDASAENLGRFRATVEAIVRGVAGGAFPAFPGEENEWRGGWTNCGFCDFNRLCSRRREEEFAAKSSDAPMAAWFRVEQAARPPEAPD